MQDETSVQLIASRRLNNRIEHLEYTRAIIRELRDMMAADRFDMLTFQLEMAYLEASDRLRELHAEQFPQVPANDSDGKVADKQ